MKKTLLSIISLFCLSAAISVAQEFSGPIVENFNSPRPENFKLNGRYSFRYFPNVPSLSEKGTDVMLLRIDPKDPAGAGLGPEMISNKLTHFGTYRARLRVPEAKAAQPNVGAVVGYFTYQVNQQFGLSEIDFEWLLADPKLIYIGTWTSAPDGTMNPSGKLQRIGRVINLAEGTILETNYYSERKGNKRHPLTGEGNKPETVPAIEGYDASKMFYEYGFDWYPDRLTWWIIHPKTNEKIILWDYKGSTPDFTGIPLAPTHYRMNFWHTNNWPVETNPKSVEKPAYPYSLEVDWMRYEPFEELNNKWQEQNKQ